MNLKSTYDKIAQDWFKDHQQDTWWIEGTDKFISFFRNGDLILDAGCGGGYKSKYLIGKGLKVVGIDFSEKMIEIARNFESRGEFKVMDIRNLTGLSRQFDGIFAQAVLLHAAKKEIPAVLDNFKSVLKDKGYLLVAVKEMKPDGKAEEIKIENDYGYPFQRFFSYFTMSEIKKYLIDADFSLCYEKTEPSGGSRWLQVIAQKG